MAFKSKYHMACVTSGDMLVIKIHYAGVRQHWDAAHCVASFGRLKIWRLRERVHYAVVILNNLLSLAHSPLLIHNSYDLQLARMPRLLCPCKRAWNDRLVWSDWEYVSVTWTDRWKTILYFLINNLELCLTYVAMSGIHQSGLNSNLLSWRPMKGPRWTLREREGCVW